MFIVLVDYFCTVLIYSPGFSEVIHGAKRWFLASPEDETILEFDPNITTTEWVERIYPTLQDKLKESKHASTIYDCIIYPNEVLYFPDRWMHATLNQEDYNFFISVFLDKDILDRSISQSVELESNSIRLLSDSTDDKSHIASTVTMNEL